MATRTTAALGLSLLVLFVLTRATGQPLTVALLGVVITMVASRSVNEPDPRQQRITMALLPVPAAVAITAEQLAPWLLDAELAIEWVATPPVERPPPISVDAKASRRPAPRRADAARLALVPLSRARGYHLANRRGP